MIVGFPKAKLEENPREHETRGLDKFDELTEACEMPWSEGWAMRPAIADGITKSLNARL
jgi:hypothetical protein